MEQHFVSCRQPIRQSPRLHTLEDPVDFARRRLRFEPDDIQQTILRSTAKRGILNCTRQWGKTTVSAAKAVHRAFTVPKSLIVVASPSLRQSGEWMRRAAEMLSRLKILKRGDGNNRISLLLPNGSRIVGLPGAEATIRGFAALSMLIIDEAARVSDETYHALRPMLSIGDGDLWMLSTPCGKQGFFYETWEREVSAQADGSAVHEKVVRGDVVHGEVVREETEAWMKISVMATDCPRISASFLEEQRSVMGMDAFRQEHMCEFIGSGSALFDRDLVDAAFTNDVEPI